MEVLHACCCGLDVHKKGVTACVLWAEGKGKKGKEKRQFGTMTRDLLALADWLRACGVTHTPAQLPRCSGSPNWFMLTPISAISPLAVTQSTPGMVPNCSISSLQKGEDALRFPAPAARSSIPQTPGVPSIPSARTDDATSCALPGLPATPEFCSAVTRATSPPVSSHLPLPRSSPSASLDRTHPVHPWPLRPA